MLIAMVNISEEDDEIMLRAAVCLAEVCGTDTDDITIEMIINKLGAILKVTEFRMRF